MSNSTSSIQDIERFIELVQISIGTRQIFSVKPTAEDWEKLYNEALRQGLHGITYLGAKKLAKQPNSTLPTNLLLKWSGHAMQLKALNEHVSAQCEELLKHFHDAGFQAIILKGQSHLPNYPEELRYLRSPGDIDIWVRGKSKKEVYKFVLDRFPEAKYGYLHIHYPYFSDTSVEVHIRPAYLFNPFTNYRLQQWADKLDPNYLHEQDNFRIFNAIYQPLHLYKHLMCEGITLRQLLDYYFLLKLHPFEVSKIFKDLSIFTFCHNLNTVTYHIFEGSPISTKPCSRLFEDIILYGETGTSPINGIWKRFKHFIRSYPNEIIWRPFFVIFQFLWRLFIF